MVRQNASNQLVLTATLEEIGCLARRVAPDAELSGRVKSAPSALDKVERTRPNAAGLLDSIGVRVILNSRDQCYRVVNLIHRRFRHIEAEYDDYIRAPKSNGHRSLHTVILTCEDRPVEVQVRTHEMHECAERGPASHRSYKELQAEENPLKPADRGDTDV